MPRLPSTKRVAFQILLAKLRAASMRAGDSLVSLPGVLLATSAKRSASQPYSSITLIGSYRAASGSDLLIFSPRSFRIRPCR